MANAVVDYVGLYFQGQYIIKEFAVARILDKSIEVEDQILIDTTALPIDHDALINSTEFLITFNKSHISWGKKSNHTREDIIAKMKSLRRHNIYLRDNIHALFLAKYLNVSPNSFKFLTSFDDFDRSDQIMKTNCKNHLNRNSYCAKNNVMDMAEWLKDKFKKSPRSKERLAVINYTGHYENPDNGSGNFIIKKLRVYCFDNNGTIISNKLIAPIIANNIDDTTEAELINHEIRYRQKYGVDWNDVNLMTLAVKSQLNKILLDNKIEFIFVENYLQKSTLHRLLDSSLNIIPLIDYGYVEDGNQTDNPDQGVKEMVDLVLRGKIYETIRQLNPVEISDTESTDSSDSQGMDI